MDEKELAKIGKKVMKIVVEKRKNPTVGEVIGVGCVGKDTYAGKCIEWGISTHPDTTSFDVEITRINNKSKFHPYFYVRLMARGA